MPIPDFTATGDLPVGIHHATLVEVLERFGAPSGQRTLCSQRLFQIYDLAKHTGHLDRMLIFGSYITSKKRPNDIDVILIMKNDFRYATCPVASRGLFVASTSQARYDATIQWIRPGVLITETVEQYIEFWQNKREGGKRGIIEVEL